MNHRAGLFKKAWHLLFIKRTATDYHSAQVDFHLSFLVGNPSTNTVNDSVNPRSL